MERLFYQYVRKLEQDGEVIHGAVFIDDTKLEGRASRYRFCWRSSVEKNLAKVKEIGAGKNRSHQCAGPQFPTLCFPLSGRFSTPACHFVDILAMQKARRSFRFLQRALFT